MVEDGNTGVDACRAGAVDLHPSLKPAFLSRVAGGRHPSKQGIAASTAHRYGFWRFRRTACGQMTPALHKLPRLTALAGLAGALTLAVTATATASLPLPPNTA